MVIGKTLIKDHTTPGVSLSDVFFNVNNLLCGSNSEGLFITAFEGVLDLVTGEFSYINAGHETPYICRKGQGYEPYEVKPGFVLAGMEDIRYEEGRLLLEPGDKVFLYTDGVPEATNAQNELYGSKRLHDSLNKHKDRTLKDLLITVKADVDAFVAEAPQFDDITMLALEYITPALLDMPDGGSEELTPCETSEERPAGPEHTQKGGTVSRVSAGKRKCAIWECIIKEVAGVLVGRPPSGR